MAMPESFSLGSNGLASPLHCFALAEAQPVALVSQSTLIFLLLHSLLADGICQHPGRSVTHVLHTMRWKCIDSALRDYSALSLLISALHRNHNWRHAPPYPPCTIV
jgi:hypothetical protein